MSIDERDAELEQLKTNAAIIEGLGFFFFLGGMLIGFVFGAALVLVTMAVVG